MTGHPPPGDPAFWDAMYARRGAGHSHGPNTFLTQHAQHLAAGAALDVACGEGADALWLAQRSWHVTAVDLSGVALARARAADVNHQVQWIHADVLQWSPPVETFDLVNVQFIHLPPQQRPDLLARLSSAVRPGGMFLFAAHHTSDLTTGLGHPNRPELYFDADTVMHGLVGDWEALERGTRPRQASNHAGGTVLIQDAVLCARRKG